MSDHPSADAVPTEAEQLHTGDDPIVDACTGVISALEEIIEELGPPRDSDVSDALELAQGALEEMRVIDAWAVAKAGEAGSASAIPTDSDAETQKCVKCGEPANKHGQFGFRDHAPRDANGDEIYVPDERDDATEIITLRQQLSAHEAEIARLRDVIFEAREACPIVRRQDYFDAPLLTLINAEISQLFRHQSRAEAAEQQVSALTQQVDQLKGYVQHKHDCEAVVFPNWIEWGDGRKADCTCGLSALTCDRETPK